MINTEWVYKEGRYEFKVRDETPGSDNRFHVYSVICLKKGFFGNIYKLHHVENHITATCELTALKAYKVKQKLIKEK